jgi:hypothetical protein
MREGDMLSDEHRQILVEAHRRFKETRDRDEFNDTIQMVKALAPEKFFHGEKDPRLGLRVFVHQPFSGHWSGRALTVKRAW